MGKPNRFQKLVADAKSRIKEISPADASKQTDAILIDVRDKDDWEAGHIRNAIHLSRGIVELEIEEQVPDVNKPIVCYCGGGSRAALVADSLQKMGYTNVHSIAGGFRDWKSAGLPTE
jgi:phage shock protein E